MLLQVEKNKDNFRAATTIENTHVLAALWQCILMSWHEKDEILIPQSWVTQSMFDEKHIPRFLISDTYVCEDKIFLQEEDKLSFSGYEQVTIQ